VCVLVKGGLDVGAALSCSERAATTVASRSTITGPDAGTGESWTHATGHAAAAAPVIAIQGRIPGRGRAVHRRRTPSDLRPPG